MVELVIMKKTKLNIALTGILRVAPDNGDRGEIIARGRWTAENPQLQELRKEHHDEFVLTGLAKRLRDFGKTATGRARSEWSPSLDHLREYSARAFDRAALRAMGADVTTLGTAPVSTVSLKELEQLALKCRELKERTPIIELGVVDFSRVLTTYGILYGSPDVCEFYYNGIFFKLNPELPAGRAKVIENER